MSIVFFFCLFLFFFYSSLSLSFLFLIFFYLYIYIYFIIIIIIIIIVIIIIVYVYVSSTCTDLAEKHVRFPQGLSLVLYLYLLVVRYVGSMIRNDDGVECRYNRACDYK